MEQTHCVVKAGGLQETVRKKEGTILLRKKKVFYQEEKWVVLCVHNNRIPLLEWYESQENNVDHAPVKVYDLLYCMFVNPVFGDDRGFIIGFADEKNSVLEFCARDAEECADWIDTLTQKLRELDCLTDTENIYAPFTRSNDGPLADSVSARRQTQFTGSDSGTLRSPSTTPLDTISQSPPPSMESPSPLMMSSPSLPPRSLNSGTLTRTRTLLTDEIPIQSAGRINHRQLFLANEYVADLYANSSNNASDRLLSQSANYPTSLEHEIIAGQSTNISTTSLMQLTEMTSAVDPDVGSPLTPITTSPLRVISQRIQYQHQQLQLSMDLHPALAQEKEYIPPLPPRKSLQEQEISRTQPSIHTVSNAEMKTQNESPQNSQKVTEYLPSNQPATSENIYDVESISTKDNIRTCEQYDSLIGSSSLATAANYDILSTGLVELRLDANIVTLSSSELASSSSRSDEAIFSSASCRMRMSELSSPVYSSPTSTSTSESHRSVERGQPPSVAVATEYDIAQGPPPSSAMDLSILMSRPKAREQYDFPSSPPVHIPTTYSAVFREALSKPRTVALFLTTCVEHIAFVEVGGKIWIAGWTAETDPLFKKLMINFGDEVVQIGDAAIISAEQLPMAFYNQSTPGVPIDVRIRSIPHGSVYSLTKSVNPKRSLGIVLHNKKNRIAAIEEKSPAWNAQVPSKVPPFIYAGSVKETPAVITQVDGVPLNPFAHDEQLFRRVDPIPLGSSFNLIVHPLDFVQLVKAQLKHNKSYKRFLHAN